MTNNTNTASALSKNDTFGGDFEFLPFAASVECGPVPSHPTSDDFQNAAMVADQSPAHRWHCEAIRYRRQHPGALLDDTALHAIGASVAESLYRFSRR